MWHYDSIPCLFSNHFMFFYIANANGMLSHLRAHICETGPEEPPEDGEMNDVPPPSRHRIRNSSPGVLRKNTLPLGHGGSTQYSIFTNEWRRNILLLLNLNARAGDEPAI